ncbi:MAG: metallophosphoesterase [Bryobacteraceae bacterium]|nr:metallophosphoesterase [Bryobacteraceae bacterium]
MPDHAVSPVSFRMAIARRSSSFEATAWSPDGHSVAAAGSDGVVWLWSAESGECRLLEGHTGPINAIAWSPDGSTVASGSYDRTVRLWDAANGHVRHKLEGHSGSVLSVAWSPDGSAVASGCDRTVRLWDAASGRARHMLEGHSNVVRSVAWSADGSTVASGSDDRTVRLWDAASGRARHMLEGHSGWVRSVAWSPDGSTVASGSDDKTVRLWDAASGRVHHKLEGHSNEVVSVAWSPDGSTVASGSYDRTVRLWDAASGRARHTLGGHSGWVLSVAWSPDGSTVASGSSDRTVRLWDAASGRARYKLEGHSNAVRSVAWSPDGSTVASGSYDRMVRLWDAASGRARHKLEGHSDRVLSVAWSPDGSTVASGAQDRMVRLWDAASGRPRHKLEGHSGWVQSVAWSPDGSTVASGAQDSTVRLWDAASGRPRHKLEGHSNVVTSVAWSPDGSTVASGSDDRTVRLWDAASGRARHKLEGHSGLVLSVAWAADGSTVASGSLDRTVRLWEAASGRVRQELESHSGWVLCLAWSPDGSTVASGADDRTVRLWDPASGREKLVLEGHEAAVTHLAWSRDNRVLASLDERGAVRLWDPATGQLLHELPPRSFRYQPVGVEAGFTPAWDNGDFLVAAVQPAAAQPETGPLAARQVLQSSAKVVLTGDSNAGKTCLARRLAEDRYIEGQPTTRGMQIWTLPPEKLDPAGAAPEGEHREIFLWDLGGQPEYQLVNQLFLRDTTVALVLFDATRGAVGLQSAEAWDERLSAQDSAPLRKLLIEAKADQPGVVQPDDVEALRRRLAFRRRLAVSAKREGDIGLAELRHELHEAIEWQNLARVSRPPAFHEIREFLANSRQSGESVIFLEDLERRLADAGIGYERGELETTLGHLAREGQIVDVVLQSGDRAAVLRIDVISRYAGSLVQAARTHASRVPALAQDHVLSSKMEFPGLVPGERLASRSEERTVLECVVRLMVERGVCFAHQGLLVFPTLFNDLTEREGTLPPSAPLYYDFSGPIDNIYASLVARLAVSGTFGPVRLWARYAEFGSEAEGTFGIRRADRSKGRGHLDLFLSGPIEPDRRRLFRDFVDDHLESQGVKILSGLAFSCRRCSFQFGEDLLADRLAANKTDVGCPRCDEKYSLFAAAQPPTAESERRLSALKTDIDMRTRESASRVAAAVSHPKESTAAPLLVLHLSDLHFTAATKLETVLQPLEADLREVTRGKALDFLVISGDFSDRCNEAGWTLAAQFVNALRERFSLDALRIVLAPGNHDLAQSNDYFTVEWNLLSFDLQGKPTVSGEPKPNDKYNSRFHRFATFYHNLYSARSYKEDPALQYDVIPGDNGLYFLALNSAWQIDPYYPQRASLNNDALSTAMREAGKVPLGMAVWHHAGAGDRKIADTDATKRLADAGFRIVLHGDVHQERDDVLHYLDDARRIYLVGSGSFGAVAKDRPESTPRSYSLLRVQRDLKAVEVERRYQKTAEGPYDGGARRTITLEASAR